MSSLATVYAERESMIYFFPIPLAVLPADLVEGDLLHLAHKSGDAHRESAQSRLTALAADDDGADFSL